MSATVVFGRIPDVPICETGTWPTSTGEFTFTTGDFTNAVKAISECPAVRNPVLYIGHTNMAGKASNGLPAVGWLGNLRTGNDGHTLIADYEGMPEWLATVAPSAYPDRSVEGDYDFRCTLGHTHPFVITALALLGVERPAVGTLASLQDIAAIWGVAAVAQPAQARQFTVQAKEHHMPEAVLATTSADDIRREFYAHAPFAQWIREIDVDPAQVVVEDEEAGGLYRIPYTISGDAITFGEPVAVVTEYRDKQMPVAAQVSHLGPRTVRAAYPDRTSSRPANAAAGGPNEGETMSELTEALVKRLGLKTDAGADDATLLAALDEALKERAEPKPVVAPVAVPATPPKPAVEGIVTIDSSTLEDLKVAAQLGRSAHERQAREDRDGAIRAAVETGRIAPARREHFEKAWAADPEGARQILASLAPGLVPLTEVGHASDGQLDDDAKFYAEVSALGSQIFGPPT